MSSTERSRSAAGSPVWAPWPEEVAAEYRRWGWWRGETLGAMLRGSAQRHHDAIAVVSGDTRLTYAELDRRCDRLARGMRDLGVGAGDRVAVQLPNTAAFVEVLFASARLGAIPVLVMPAYRQHELRSVMEIAEPVAYVVPDGRGGHGGRGGFDYRAQAAALLDEVPTLRHVVVAGDAGDTGGFTPLADLAAHDTGDDAGADFPDVDPEAIALCVMSGGTTGAPKLVPRTHENYAYLPTGCRAAGLDSDEVYLATLPLAHNFPLSCPGLLGTLQTGGTAVMAPSSSPDEVFPLIERERVTWSTVVPTIVDLWTHAVQWHSGDLSSLRMLQVGGAVFRPETARRAVEVLGCGLQQVYGMAEGLLTMTALDDPEELVLTTQGRPPSPGDEIRVVDAEGDDVEPGAVGELWTRGPSTVRGYLGVPAGSSESFTPDAHYRTGDLARRLPSGHLVIEGRVKDVINRGGDKVPCEELEGHLLAHPAVRSVAAVPVPDPGLGERVCVYLVTEEDAELPTLRTLRVFLQERGVASFKFPERVEPIDRLPLTKIGKIDRKSLTAQAVADRGADHG